MPVDAHDLERELQRLRAEAAGPVAGLLGPHSMAWRVDRESVIFLGAGRALLLQLAHPWVAAAIREHSRSLDDPVGRFHRTFEIVFTMVFGSLDQSLDAARRLHRRHASVTGKLPGNVGSFPAGSAYRANEIPALQWVHATLTETSLMVHDLVLPPLTGEERERYFAESRRLGGLFGIPRETQPADWAGFSAYVEAMLSSDTLTVGPEAREIADRLFGEASFPLRMPAWYRAVTAQLMPPRLREAYDLPYGSAERRAAERALAWIRRTQPLLPARLRYVGPYHEALARLEGRPRPELATRWLNRLWMGRPSMGDG